MAQRHFRGAVFLLLLSCCRVGIASEVAEGNPAVVYGQARAALVAADIDTAERLFGELVARYPDNADFLLGLGQARLAGHQVDAAIDVLERARQLAPAYPDVLQVLASAYLIAGDQVTAAAIKKEGARLDPDAGWTQLERATREGSTQPGQLTVAYANEATRTESNETWHESSVNIEYSWARATLAGFRAARSQRFDQQDSLYELYGSLPVTDRIAIAGRAQMSPDHRVRPERGGLLEASMTLAHGWVVTAGGGRTEYNSGPSDKAVVTLERYFSNYRLSYTEVAVQPEGGPWSPVHRLGGSWYYGDDNRLNFNLAFGEETDESVTGAASQKFDTWGAGLGGRHWFSPRFAIDYATGYEGLESDRGDHLDRTTFYVGIVFRP